MSEIVMLGALITMALQSVTVIVVILCLKKRQRVELSE
jgi:hypothetical protein